MGGQPSVPVDVLAQVSQAASRDSGAVPADYLGDFLPALCTAVADGEPFTATRLRPYHRLGDRAARHGVALRALLDLYLSAAWRLWPHLPAVLGARRDPDGVVAAGQVMLHACDDVVAALTEGFQLARRSLLRSQESARREFVDDLLGGSTDVVGLLARADGFGLDLSGPHAVAVATAEQAFDDGQPVMANLERSIQGGKGDAPPLLASKDGRLVVVFAAPDDLAIAQIGDQLAKTLKRAENGRTPVGRWQLGISRPRAGGDGVVASYREALDALDLAASLQIPTPVVDARDLLAYRVLVRDRAALADLVDTTLGPLRAARGGPAPLLATLSAWFGTGQNATATARTLHLSVRAVGYRLDRVAELTGFDVTQPADRFTLQVATLGATLLDWPPPPD